MSKSHENLINDNLVENEVEKEKEPRKRVVLIRHPEQDFKLKIPTELAKGGEDINTHSPITKRGLKQVRQLSEYLEREFPWEVSDKEYSIHSSPIKRAKDMASILDTSINLKITDGAKIPIPANNNEAILNYFSEITIATDIVTDNKIAKEAKRKGVDFVDAWLEMEGEKLLPRFQSKLNDIRRGLVHLEQQSTKLDIVVSHGMAIATTIWAANNPKKFKDIEYELTMEDLKEIIERSKNIPYTSITEFNIYDDGISVEKIGITPHLEKENK